MKFRVSTVTSAFLAAWLCLNIAVSAGEQNKPLSQFIHDVWQTDQGLPQNTVFAVVQTRDGYVWLATQEGLVRFDGMRFTVFDKRNTPQIKENNVQALCEDREGNLWIGIEGGGLVRLREGRFTAYTVADGLADNIVDALYEDRAGALWIGTLGGLNRLKDGQFTRYTTTDGLANDTVLAICEDQTSALWIGTEAGGLCRFKDGKFTTYTTRDGLAGDLVRTVYEDRAGALWVGTGVGLSRFRDGKFATFTTKDGLADNSIFSIYEDRAGQLWIATRGGLTRYDNGRFTAYTTKDGLSEDRVLALCEDREGNLWVGTYEGGLNRFKEGRFAVYTAKDGLAGDIVRPVYEGRRGDVWVGTSNGLSRQREGKIINYTIKDGLVDNNILALYEDRAGTLWIGTSGGLNRFKDGKFTAYTTARGLTDNTVLSICESPDGDLWFGTASGLNRFKNEKFTAYTTREGLSNDSIWSLYADPAGALWIGTDGGGLNRFKDEKFTAYTSREGLANDIVLALYDDGAGSLWIGTSGGLSRLQGERLTAYTTAEGLFDDVVFQILEDGKNNLWMSCNRGVFRVSKAELDELAQGKTQVIASVSYGTADGMKSRECNGGFQPAGCKTRDGRLWFPTIKGVAVIDPETIKLNPLAPPVMIESVLVDHEPIEATPAAKLAPGKSKFEFHYTGLSFIAPEKVRFKYKLEGFDREWVDAGTRREVSYTNIPPGNYTFRVMACNDDGVWNETGAAFGFYLRPHFYQTYWFYGLGAALVGLVGLGLYRLRVRRMQSQFEAVLAERNRIAREIHDTLAQGFAGISLQLEAVDETLQDAPAAAREHLNRARSLVRSSLTEARRSVWELRSPALESAGLGRALADIARQLTAGLSLPVHAQVKGTARSLPANVENNLLHIGREALTNAVKHAQASHINLELRFERASVWLTVKDDGKGFDVERARSTSGGGFGLISMRERAQQIGGRLTITSTPADGTEVRVEVSL